MNIGDRIMQARKLRGMTQGELVEKLDISFAVLDDIERGYCKPISTTLTKICDALNVSADYLLGRVDERTDRLMQDIMKLGEEERANVIEIVSVLAEKEEGNQIKFSLSFEGLRIMDMPLGSKKKG